MKKIIPHIPLILLAFWTFASATTVQLDSLVGTNDVLQCYHIGTTHVRCRNLRTGEDWRVCERENNTHEKWAGSINQDGAKLVLEDGKHVAVVNLDGSQTDCHKVLNDQRIFLARQPRQ